MNSPAYGQWEEPYEAPLCRTYSRHQGFTWPPKSVQEEHRAPTLYRKADDSRHVEPVLRGFKTDAVTNMLANAFIRGPICECIENDADN